jgi:hypothetical protein
MPVVKAAIVLASSADALAQSVAATLAAQVKRNTVFANKA